jgi:hypothetical protein
MQSHVIAESLESRRLLSASVAGVLTVRGTAGADRIVISVEGKNGNRVNVSVNGDVTRFRAADVEEIVVFGGPGADRIVVDESVAELEIEATLHGGGGNDTVIGSAGDETLTGGDGDDALQGRAGDDELDGGGGTDRLRSGAGEDVFNGPTSEFLDLGGDDGVRVKLADIPAAARTKINAERGRNKLSGLFREVSDGETVFEAEFLERRFARSIKVKEDGTMIEDELEIELSDLPAAVLAAVRAEYPDGEITEVERGEDGVDTFYEVEVELEDSVRELKLSPTGQILDDSLA